MGQASYAWLSQQKYAFRPHDGEPAERAERVDGAVRLREHQLPLLQPHAQHRPQPTQLK